MHIGKPAKEAIGFQLLQQNYPRLKNFIQLTRLDRPIGIYLLLWPTLWALWIAATGIPSRQNLIIFILGVILMRSAGCVINDYADRHFDGEVKRTHQRPIVTGKVQPVEALKLFAVLVLLSFLLVLMTNPLAISLSFAGLGLAALYPFAKRYTHLPQIVLGAAFGWAIPMAFAAESGALGEVTWLLFLANLFWTVAYDTQYAMVDRDDDQRIGIKSTAILFGDMDNLIITVLQGLALITLAIVGEKLSLGPVYYSSLIVMAGLFAYQHKLTQHRDRDACLKAFLGNHWAGAVIFVGIAISYLA